MDTYAFHHSIDSLILRASEKILKTKSLEKSKQHFYYDFSNDIGIINLLRQTYLQNGDLRDVFEFYQHSRLEPKSYRYESLIATLIIAIVGNIISGILLDTYTTNKSKIIKLFDEKLILSIKKIPEKIQNKFLKGNNNSVKKDFEKLINCYISRIMLDRQLIALDSYYELVDYFMYDKQIENTLKGKYDNFLNEYLYEENSMNMDKIYDIIVAYSKGVYLKYLDEAGCEILYFENIKTANQINGISASNGFYKGNIIKIDNDKDFLSINESEFNNKVLCYGGAFSPERLNILFKIGGVVTWKTGITGHLPVICRSIGIPCVIITEAEANKLINNDDIMVSGIEGLIYTGLFVKQ